MARYATALAGDPAQTYRTIDLAGRTGGADPHALVALLYEEAIRALRSAAWATIHRRYAMKSERVTRATAILFALESGLDFETGGDLSHTLSRLYAGLRSQVVNASVGEDARPFEAAALSLTDIADAWGAVRPR
ncbi:flagellar export chaperone FliS [Sphingomonas sp. CFBP 13720]|jgi:flagellar protein FliS|uniref:flagellar export chaperone FliS n=1 Tax=Sphingomonas sp. CFBP 13720 TaxID=2775302 RepID=UPI00177C9DDB|nr:flagellar protein FliS [Sphingomonas sp. CFBP 13720]MBD8677859.1 flagellar protein FliS [Sphingomonas sp. CFBP 13720]